MIAAGLILLPVSFFFFTPDPLLGSYSNPLEAEKFYSSQELISIKDKNNYNFPDEYYIEIKTTGSDILNIKEAKNLIPMTYKKGLHYQHSYIYQATLTEREYVELSAMDDIVGIWRMPRPIIPDYDFFLKYITEGDMDDAMQYSGATQLISEGHDGTGTIIVIIDLFPEQSYFNDYFPTSWNTRILRYAGGPYDNSAIHGIMTTSIAATVSPQSKLYLINMAEENYDLVSYFQTMLNLKNQYPDYNIVSSNSYVMAGLDYTWDESPANRKILEVAHNDIIVCFGAGNWGKEGDHDPQWTLDGGYDERAGNYIEQIGYPAVFNEVISVAGCNAFCDKILTYSSIGPGVDDHDEPDVSAPTHFDFSYSPYGASVGTSGSTPFMAGICSLILTNHDPETDRMVGAIHSSSTDKGESGFDYEFGYGVVDADKLIIGYETWIPTPENEPFLYGIFSGLGLIGIGSVCLVYEGKKVNIKRKSHKKDELRHLFRKRK